MVDRLHYDIVRKVLGIAENDNGFGLSTNVAVTSNTSGTGRNAPQTNNISFPGIADVRLLPLFDSLARLQNGSFNLNNSNENRQVAIARPSIPQAANTLSISQEQLLRTLLMTSSNNQVEKSSTICSSDAKGCEETNAPKKRSSSFSFNHERLKKKKSRPDECKISASNNVAIVSVQLSDAERRESFPLPPRNGRQPRKMNVSKSNLASLSKIWDDYEMICYNMDDTVADQQAFVKRLFIQSLHRTKLCHLKDRIQPLSSNGPDPNVGVSRVLK